MVCTPHLGAATTEAQENVALQVAEQMSDYLIRGAISNAVNFPSITAEEAPRLQAVHRACGEARLVRRPAHRDRHQARCSSPTRAQSAQMNTKALTSAAIAGLLRPMLQDVNVVSAPIVAKERGIVDRGDDARGRRRLREPDHRDGRDRAADALASPARSLPTAGRASSTSRASAWTRSSAPR